jgi:hypothetical protein
MRSFGFIMKSFGKPMKNIKKDLTQKQNKGIL